MGILKQRKDDSMKVSIIVAVVLACTVVFAGEGLNIGSVNEIRIMRISPQDERAVIKTPDGKMEMIKVGDSVGGGGKIVEITKDRVVIEEGTDTVIIRLEDGKQTLERVGKTPPRHPTPYGAK
jgi:hypothetical protein